MTTVDINAVKNLAAKASSVDKVAGIVFTQVGKLDISGKAPVAGVRFSAIDEPTSFRANVHRINLLVRYEHEVHTIDGIKVLRGVFRACLDEPVKSDQTVIGEFSFDSFGKTNSTGDLIKPLLLDPDLQHSVKEDVAYWLAYEVQRHIEVKSRQAKVMPLNY